MKQLYIDFDGVIVDTYDILYKMMHENNIDKNDYDSSFNFIKCLNWDDLLSNAAIINDAFGSIQKIIDSNKFDVSILTHVISLEEAVAKITYIRKYFKDITIIPVPKTISKTKMVHTKDAILIDDYTGNLIEWQSEGGISVRFSRKLNGKGFLVLDELDLIIDMYKEIYGKNIRQCNKNKSL